MKKTFRKTSAMLCAITVAASSMSLSGFVASAGEPAPTSDYTITIPATLTVANSGWNATDGVSATGTLEDGKKLVVTATSDDEFALVNQEDNTQKIGYKLATASTDTEATTSWEFTELSGTAATKPMGIIVDDYSDKPAGTYQDFVTFTATVESASTPLDTNTTAWTAGTFAVPAGGLTYSDAVTVSGDVTLTLTDGETLTLNKGISLASGATLTVEGNGTMNVNGTNNSTASTVAGTGTLVLTSGTLNAKGGNGQGVGDSAVGTDNRANAGGNAINGNVTVSGGTLTATGGNGGGVGARSAYSYGAVGAVAISGNVTITDGTVTATGGNGGSIGAMGMYEYGGNGGAAIGGDATISGGTWTATDGTHGVNGDGQGGAGGKAVAGTVTDNRN